MPAEISGNIGTTTLTEEAFLVLRPKMVEANMLLTSIRASAKIDYDVCQRLKRCTLLLPNTSISQEDWNSETLINCLTNSKTDEEFCFVLTTATQTTIRLYMRSETSLAEINIHLRARAEDKNIIDQAAGIIGSNRSQFMLASALKEAKNILLDQSTIHVDAKAFNDVMKWMDNKAGAETKKGMKRLLKAKPLW
jgi:uncharacterized protein (DUF1778 family)